VDMASRMIDKFDKYWSKMNGLLAIASMLDPRNKLDCVDFYSKFRAKEHGGSSPLQRIISRMLIE